MKMKHASYEFETMSPSELMVYLNGRHYPAVNRLMDQIDLHLSAMLRMDAGVHASFFKLNSEYRELSVLVKYHLQRNEEFLFPFIYRTLEEGLDNFKHLDNFEKELTGLHDSHMRMRLLLASLSECSQGYKPEPEATESKYVVYSELHSLEGYLYRQFYLEDVLLVQKVNTVLFQSFSQFYIE